MKKSLLLTTALVMATTAVSAQPFVEKVPFGARQFGKQLFAAPQHGPAITKRKAATSEKTNYYMRPEGSLYFTSSKAGEMYGPVYMYVSGASDILFKKVGSDQTAWHLNAYNFYDELTASVNCSEQSSDSYYLDNDGNLHFNMVFDGANSLPTLTWQTDSFTIGEENPYFAPNSDTNPNAFLKYYPQVFSGENIKNERTMPLSYTDDHVSEVYFGGMPNNYVYGSGSFTEDNGAKYTATGVYQYFEKPMSPLYVQDIFLPAISQGYYPIAQGKELKMQIHDVMEVNGTRIPGDKILYELTATEPEVIDVGSLEYDNDNYYNAFTVVFTKKDAEGNAVPFVLDQPFYVVVYGLDGEGIDCGFEVSLLPKYYDNFDSAVGIWKDANNQADYFGLYEQNHALKVSFTGMFDYCNPMYYGANENYGIVKMSDDGNEGTTQTSGENVYPGAMIKVNSDWFDSAGEPQYTVTGAADWVRSITADAQTYKDYGITLLTFKCDALPEGVSGRKCSLTIHGKGVQSTYPIEILQGDATPTGVTGVTVTPAADGATYNVAGQRVADNARGLVIRGGKKYLNK